MFGPHAYHNPDPPGDVPSPTVHALVLVQVSPYDSHTCHDAGSLLKLLWPMSIVVPVPSSSVVISPLSTVLATAFALQPPINITASVRTNGCSAGFDAC